MLMCPPDHFNLHYSINPWMQLNSRPVRLIARRQWEILAATFRRHGQEIALLTPQPGLPDMVFVDAGVTSGRTFIPSNFRYPERQGERRHFIDWFASRGYDVVEVEESAKFEGHGDTVWADSDLYCGYGFRSQIEAHKRIAEILPETSVVSLELVDPRFYHLDTCFCALGNQSAMYVRRAFSKKAQRVLSERLDLIEVDEEEALRFACNAVVIGRDVVLPSGTGKTCEMLGSYGYHPHPVDVSEFIKAGGACKCLTLQL